MSEPSFSDPSGFEPLRSEVQPGDTVYVTPVGEMDISTVGIVDDELSELMRSGFRNLVLDLRKLSFMDSSGLRLLLQWDAYARRDGITFAVIQGPPVVQRVFELTGLLDKLPLRDA
jgi:anti-anti-sigma factor